MTVLSTDSAIQRLAGRVAELERRLANTVRTGTVEELDAGAGRVRVRYGDEAVTAPVPWLAEAAGETRDWRPPDPGEQVLLVSPMGEMGLAIAVPAVYRDSFPAPGADAEKNIRVYGDKAELSYDSKAHALSAVLPSGGTLRIEAPGGAAVEGDLEIDGDLTVDGDISATGDISADGDVSDRNGSMQEMRTTYNAHVHGVAPGPVTPPVAPNSRME